MCVCVRAGVRIERLAKTYDNGKVAVKSVSFNMYEDQITCLLGHNGAGVCVLCDECVGVGVYGCMYMYVRVRAGVRIERLAKTYDNGKAAVKSVSSYSRGPDHVPVGPQ